MNTIFVFSQNLKLDYLCGSSGIFEKGERNYFITTHYLFDNERERISSVFPNCEFYCFADFINDEEMEDCDKKSYIPGISLDEYVSGIKKRKNRIIIQSISKSILAKNKYLFSDDLGIDKDEWIDNGYKYFIGEYYYVHPKESNLKKVLRKNKIIERLFHSLKRIIKKEPLYKDNEVFVADYMGKKYVFLGRMQRIAYRLDIDFHRSKEECDRLNKGKYEDKSKCVYVTTWHEHNKCRVPDSERYAVRWAQDGYLPPNYSHHDYDFKPDNVIYYCWDVLGSGLFKNQNLPYEMIPFRKKIYLPQPVFPKNVKSILIVASGSGDWTALKNRSDDDLLVAAFAKMAIQFPEIEFVYRCHPTWVHPEHLGVNSINRVYDYFASLNLPNIKISSNIPSSNEDGSFILSYSRSSLDDDLKNADLVFGEHSEAMIDAGFKKIPFCSVNLSNRRNFFIGITELGFPHCESLDEIKRIITSINKEKFQEDYLIAVENYNKMTDVVF